MSETKTIDQHAWDSWVEYKNNLRSDTVNTALDSMTDEQYWVCDEIYLAGFQAGVAFVMAMGKPKDE